MTNIFYVDGEYVLDKDASIPVSDVGLLRGYGIFDYTRTFNGKPFRLDDHVARLFRSAAFLDLPMLWSADQICDIVHETLARNDHLESSVRIVVTGGNSPNNMLPTGESRLTVLAVPFKPQPQEYYVNGAKVITVTEGRYMPWAKSLNYIPAVKSMKQAVRQDALDAIYLNANGDPLEGTTSNLFAFIGDTLVTAPEDEVLPGITRKVVLELAAGLFKVEQRLLSLDELYQADEAFLTSSSKDVLPLRQIDDVILGKPGPNTQKIMRRFYEYAGVPSRI